MRAFHANYPLYNILPYFGYFKYDGANGNPPLNTFELGLESETWNPKPGIRNPKSETRNPQAGDVLLPLMPSWTQMHNQVSSLNPTRLSLSLSLSLLLSLSLSLLSPLSLPEPRCTARSTLSPKP